MCLVAVTTYPLPNHLLAPSNYYVTVQEAPEGYTCDPEQKFYFEGDATELTVTITKN